MGKITFVQPQQLISCEEEGIRTTDVEWQRERQWVQEMG